MHKVSGTVFTKQGIPKYKFEGKYTGILVGTDLETNESFELTRAPVFPEPPQKPERTYGFNLYAFQMNYLPPKMKEMLPPSDSRLRPDIRAWEEADMEKA